MLRDGGGVQKPQTHTRLTRETGRHVYLATLCGLQLLYRVERETKGELCVTKKVYVKNDWKM
jgi:hypothetical protein